MRKQKQILSILLVLCILVYMNTFGIEAAKKIKSKSVSLSATTVTVAVGDIVTINAVMKPINSTDTLKWRSSDKNVATVNNYGTVTAKAEGSTTITVKTSSKKTAKCTVKVVKYLTKSEIKKLIQQNILSEETVKKLIAENSISKETVKKLIAENSISEETVKKLIAENNNSGSKEWQDGTELKCYNASQLPMTYKGITINTVSVKKYHCSEIFDGHLQKYKYVISVSGTVPEDSLDSLDDYFGIDLMFNNDVRYYPVKDFDTFSLSLKNGRYILNGNSFSYSVEHYNMFEDYDEFMLWVIHDFDADV